MLRIKKKKEIIIYKRKCAEIMQRNKKNKNLFCNYQKKTHDVLAFSFTLTTKTKLRHFIKELKNNSLGTLVLLFWLSDSLI